MFPKKPELNLQNPVGIGFKSQYLTELSQGHNAIGWLEIHAENYMIEGGPRKKMMQALSEIYPISCHGVGLSIGAETGLNQEHINRLKELISWLKPFQFSEHLAWSSHNAGYFNDLLPLPYTQTTLNRVITHINQVQDQLGQQILLENPSTYVTFKENEMGECEFIKAIVDHTGCGLLLDINNVFVSATNQKYDPYAYIDAYPLNHVKEFHLGGHDEDSDDKGDLLLIDSHNHPVTDPVWQLYEYTIHKTGLRPTLIEWDSDLPEFSVLENEARRAAFVIHQVKENSHAFAS